MVMAAHDLPSSIQWHEGMLLAPQHFQQLSVRQEQLLAYNGAMLSPFHWGIRHLRIDTVLLLEGTFRVLEMEAILPDGLVVSSSEAERGALDVDLQQFRDHLEGDGAAVHLAIPSQRSGSSTVQGEWARYRSVDGAAVLDQNTGQSELRIPRLLPRLRLLVGDRPPDKYSSIALARVCYRNEGFQLLPFEPPRLRVPQSCLIGEMVAKVTKRLREKAVFLAERLRAPSSATRMPQLLETKGLIHSLVAPLPPLETLLATGRAHPLALYLALTSAVGHLASLGRGLVPPVLEPYDHDDLYSTFDQALRYITQVIDEGIQESYTSFPFYFKKGAFYIHFDDEWQGAPLVLGVRSKEGATEEEIRSWVEESLIGSRSRIAEMRSLRIRGAVREAVSGDADLVPARGVQLYSLEEDPDFVKPNEPLFIVNLDDTEGRRRPLEIVLYVRNRS